MVRSQLKKILPRGHPSATLRTSRTMSQGSIIPATTLPLFEALEPHLVAGHDLIPLKRLDKVPLHAGWPIETPLTYDEAHAHMANGGNIASASVPTCWSSMSILAMPHQDRSQLRSSRTS